jgi:uncharacterized protein YndB with AHSA1/START domain
MTARKSSPAKKQAGQETVITRNFAAPREMVFDAWIDPAHLAQWWGPKGFTNPVCEWDARPGRAIHVVMRAPNGVDYPMGGEFREVVAPERLVFTSGALDEQGKLLFEFLHTVAFTERNGMTTITIRSRITKTTPGADKYTDGFEAGMTQSLERLEALVTGPATREIVISRVLHAPRELVWQAWTDPKHVTHWWGPRGFTNTTKRHEFRVGGVWEHIMHGPDGANYPNKSTFKEIVPLERITFSHGGGRETGPGATFTATWTFETVEGNKTRLTGRLVFPTAEARNFVVKEFGAIEGGKQTLERASEYVAGLQAKPFVISREFAAPRDMVWKAWTERDQFEQWFGPKGVRISIAKFDLRPAGMIHYSMTMPDGTEIWGKAVYREIVPPEKLVWINSFSDKDGGITRHPLNPDPWPLQMLTVATLAEQDGKTTVTITWLPFDATDAERQTFEKGRESMKMGWTGTFDQLEAYLKTA